MAAMDTCRATAGILALLLALSGCGKSVSAETEPDVSRDRWSTAWSTAQMATDDPTSMLLSGSLQPADSLSDQTVRVILRVTADGDQIRIKLGNSYEASGMKVDAATVALRAEGAELVPGTIRTLQFGGHPDVTVPARGEVVSDPMDFPVRAQQDLAVSLYVSGAGRPGQDPNAWVSSYLTDAETGNHSTDESGGAFTATTPAAILVEELSVRNPRIAGAIIAVGTSLVDGHGSTQDGYDRWTDVLARRILAELPEGQRLGLGNEGVGGDTTADVLARFGHDVLSRPGLSHVILFAGTNDLTLPPPLNPVLGDQASNAAAIMANLREMIGLAHGAGVKIILSTVTPRLSFTPEGNAQRKIVNDWIRGGGNCSGECDGIVDFDAVIAGHLYPNAIDPAYDSGDTFHPNPEGQRRMAESIDLRLFQ